MEEQPTAVEQGVENVALAVVAQSRKRVRSGLKTALASVRTAKRKCQLQEGLNEFIEEIIEIETKLENLAERLDKKVKSSRAKKRRAWKTQTKILEMQRRHLLS